MRYISVFQGNKALLELNVGIGTVWKTTTPS